MLSGSGTEVGLQYGPFHRLESPTQSKDVADLQVRSGEIWGQAARWSSIPAVKAYHGPLPAGHRGIEFVTSVRPHLDSHRTLARWLDITPGVLPRPHGFVSIPVVVTKNTQV
jgi:hypothetical protein